MKTSYDPQDERFMRRALALARRGSGRTSPNPMVGALIVRNGQVVGQGFHPQAGHPHAEVLALREAGADATGSTLYSTLEPCCVQGRTPPCTKAIIEAGIAAVVIGTLDTNPSVNGKGVAALEKAGVAVTAGVLEQEATRLNESYNKYITTGIPFVTMKVAVSIDGKIAAREGKRTPLSGERAKAMVRRLRSRCDAVVVGSRTALIDNPVLKADHSRGGKQPMRVVLDSTARLPLDSQLVMTSGSIPTTVAVTGKAPPDRVEKLNLAGLSIIKCDSKDSKVDLADLLDWLGKLEVSSILVEAGSILATGFVEQDLVDKFIFVVSPRILGGEGPSLVGSRGILDRRLEVVSHKMYGDDLVITCYPSRADGPAENGETKE